ncbi:MAG: AraC family transcriptional regulator [Clostridia bacterium]|nr:AraC family transcriptional regulator [Clostridia bacterium]
MKNAKTMLELYGNDMSIGEVAERCGIIDQSIFSRIFKKHFGVSPTDYKNNR